MEKLNMSWKYIAGFFDGEGSITIYDFTRKRTILNGTYKTYKFKEQRIRLNITNTNFIFIQMKQQKNKVLYKIKKFLRVWGIGKNIHINKSNTNCSYIQIAAKKEAQLFLEKVLPHLIVKKSKALLALRVLKRWEKWKKTRIRRNDSVLT